MLKKPQKFARQHFGGNPKCFNYEGWKSLYAKHGGVLPLRIKAVKEGSVVARRTPSSPSKTPIPNSIGSRTGQRRCCCSLVSRLRSPRSAAPSSRSSAKRWFAPAILPCCLSSCTTLDSAASAAANPRPSAAPRTCSTFVGTDNLAAIELLQQYYGADMPGVSIPASEHSTITAWGSEHEADAYENILDNAPEGIVACVSDSYDIYNAVRNLWGGKLHDKVMQRNGTLVIRPDSGEAVTVLEAALQHRRRKNSVRGQSQGLEGSSRRRCASFRATA